MTTDPSDDAELVALFGTARSRTPEMSETLKARLADDIEVHVKPPTPRSAPPRRRPAWSWLPAAGGLVAATAVGVAIGLSTPASDIRAFGSPLSDENFDLSAFYAGADPRNFFLDGGDL